MKKIALSIILLSALAFGVERNTEETKQLKEININSNFEANNQGYAIVQKNRYKINKIVFNSKEEYAEILFYEKKTKLFNYVIGVEKTNVCNVYVKKK